MKKLFILVFLLAAVFAYSDGITVQEWFSAPELAQVAWINGYFEGVRCARSVSKDEALNDLVFNMGVGELKDYLISFILYVKHKYPDYMDMPLGEFLTGLSSSMHEEK